MAWAVLIFAPSIRVNVKVPGADIERALRILVGLCALRSRQRTPRAFAGNRFHDEKAPRVWGIHHLYF